MLYYLTNGFQSADTYISIYTIFRTGSFQFIPDILIKTNDKSIIIEVKVDALLHSSKIGINNPDAELEKSIKVQTPNTPKVVV